MRYPKLIFIISLSFIFILNSCNKDNEESNSDCSSDQIIDYSRGDCDQNLTPSSSYSETTSGNNRLINANSIPNHLVGLFGQVQGALNPNAISVQNENYLLTLAPNTTATYTPLLSSTGPAYSFGILLNGVELDPIAAEPFPHEGIMSANVNWEWNLEATNVNLGLDCNNAHVQPNGKYHYHGAPTSYLEDINVQSNQMTLIGYAADGFPIYYKYAYSTANSSSSTIIEMTSSYQLKSGDRSGDGITAPCGEYNGVYSADYEFIENLGTLDEANGRTGVTPEYPTGTYYYVLTESFPIIPRYFKGTPSNDFKI